MAICPSFIGAQVLRVTRLDNCGRPVYGECSQVVSSGFVSVEISPQVQEGEDYTQRNAAGDLCVSERGQDTLQWFTVSIEFCQVDPALFSLMNPTWKVVEDALGEPVGFRIGTRFSDRQGFALELWPKTSSSGNLCPEDAPDDAQPSGYFLLPYVIGTAPESWTLEDGVATFTLNGRTKGGSGWGRGPYYIRHGAQGQPDFLADPINNGAEDNNPDHFHAEVVTLAPPEAACGCQPLTPIAPGIQGGQITINPSQSNLACFTPSGSAARQVTIDWGDGSEPVTGRVGREECHVYTSTGTYTVTVTDIDNPDLTGSGEVTITEIPPLQPPVLNANPRSGSAPLTVNLSVNNHGNGQVTLDWGDGSAVETVDGGNSTTPRVYTHVYTNGAVDPYTITVTAVDDDTASSTLDITVALPDLPNPTVTVDPASGEAPLETTATFSNHGNGQVTLNWGDGSAEETVDGGTDAAPATATHTYADPGEYTVTVTAVQNPSAQGTATVTATAPVPPVSDPNGLLVTDPTATSLTVTWDWEAGAGPDATGFEVRYRTPAGTGTWSAAQTVAPDGRSAEITGLTASTEYEVGVTAVSTGSSSNEATVTGSTIAA